MAKELDPVCGMTVDTERAKHKAVYRGRIYCFCSERCKKAFERNPESYLEGGPRGMP